MATQRPPEPPAGSSTPDPSTGPPADRPTDPLATPPSLFGRLGSAEPRPREMAWREFYHRYVPVIRAFARSLGVRPGDVEDVVHDVLLGFFGTRATFVYDPAKGRFRNYLKTATVRALAARRRQGKVPTVSLGGGDGAARVAGELADANVPWVDDAWTAEWERHVLDRAMADVRQAYRDNKTFRAFELFAILGLPADEVAGRLDMTADGVYQAKKRVTDALRKRVAEMEADEL